MDQPDVVVALSGGIDSTVLLYDLATQGLRCAALGVNYGQAHRHQELAAAEATCGRLGVGWRATPLDWTLFAGSELTGGEGVVVPNRNMVLIALAGAWAERLGAGAVAVACHAGDAALFPDCRPAFLEEAFRALRQATERRVRLLYPYARLSKLEVVRRGVELGVPFDLTWSCYRGGPDPCGECLACRERREALLLAGSPA